MEIGAVTFYEGEDTKLEEEQGVKPWQWLWYRKAGAELALQSHGAEGAVGWGSSRFCSLIPGPQGTQDRAQPFLQCRAVLSLQICVLLGLGEAGSESSRAAGWTGLGSHGV